MANLILWNSFNEDYNASRPLGPHQLAHWLTLHGYTVKVIDFSCHLTTDELVAISEKHIGSDTIAIGVSNTFWSRQFVQRNTYEPEWVISARDILATRFPNIKWLMGGSNTSAVTNL